MSHDNPNFLALGWLTGEINDTLAQARQQLEAFASASTEGASAADNGLLKHCLELIHQVHGSLHMAELSGAAMLAEEMEQLVQALAGGEVENSDETREFLMRALLELPLYLEKVSFQRRDNPILLLPLLNDLRAVRRERLITEGALFAPDLSPLEQVRGKRQALTGNNAKLQELVGKLRKMYHVAGAGLIRDVNSKESLAYLVKVAEKMSLLYSGSVRRPLWEILLGIFEAVAEHRISVMPALRQLLRRIDVEFRLLAGRGAKVLDARLDRDLVRNLLFYVYLAGPNGPRCQALYQTYALDKAVPGTPRPDTENALAMGPEALGTAVEALREELRLVRETLEPETASTERPPLSDTAAIAKRVADTLGVLGLENQRARARTVYECLRDAARGQDVDELLLRAAGDLVQLDTALASTAARNKQVNDDQPLMGDATNTVLREARLALEVVKEAVVEYIASHWDISYLSRVPERLQEVCGGLEMVGYQRAGKIVDACKRYVSERLIEAEEQPEWKLLDTLADAITSVEYYLERRSDGIEDADMLLALAEDSVATLGFAVTDEALEIEAEPLSVGDAATADETEATADFIAELPNEPVQEPISAAETTAVEEGDYTAELQLAGTQPTAVETVEPEFEPEPEPDTTLSADADAHAEPVETAPAASLDDDDNLIDDEIVEIFLEESAEVLETIGHYFPQWAANFGNRDALVEFRRGFHTLKGSGRMVEAVEVGELAWAVENMLNRVIDDTVQPTRAHVELVEQVRRKLPSMIEGFRLRTGDPDPQRTAQLEAWAQQLANGEEPEDLLAASESQMPEIPAAEEAADAGEDIDQLWEIFAQEAETHLAVVDEFLAEMRDAAPLYDVPSDPMHRALHTLKGSAHMAEVTAVAQLVAPLERFAKELRTYQVSIDADIFELFSDGADYVRRALEQIRAGESPVIEKSEQFLARVAELQERSVGQMIREREANQPKSVDPQLLAVIMADGMKVLLDADQMLKQWRSNPADKSLLAPVAEELQVLEEAASRAQLPTLAELSRLLLNVYRKVIDGRLEVEPALWSALEEGHSELLDLVDAVAAAQDLPEVSEAVGEALRYLAQGDNVSSEEDDYDLAELGIDSTDIPVAQAEEEAPVASVAASDDSGDWGLDGLLAAEADHMPATEDEQRTTPAAEENALVPPVAEAVEPAAVITTEEVGGLDTDGRDEAGVFGDLSFDDLLIADGQSSAPSAVEGSETPLEEQVTPAAPMAEEPASTVAEVRQPVADTSPSDDELQKLLADIDPDVVEVFLEEAGDLVDELEELIQEWEQAPADQSQAEALKRVLHTFKGGARMAGVMGLGEVAHRFETVIEGMQGKAEPSMEFFADAHAIYDRIAAGVETVRAWMGGEQLDAFAQLLSTTWADAQMAEDTAPAGYQETPEVTPVLDEPRQAAEITDTTPEPPAEQHPQAVPAPRDEPPSNVLPFIRKKAGVSERESGAGVRNQPQEMVRVAAELLEELVNLAGETSISRSRLEEQISEFGLALDEMDSTLQRLNEQLRRLDMETEAQILFRQEQLAEQDDDFDPLEMDRYSSIQQLSRSLLESTSDLMELRATLGNKARDTETLLLQQSRVNTELQEGLMRSRMVPFSRLVPRLRRIVRQVSAELGKQVDLVFSNVEGELDRSMLERMVAPLEHMLRNAVDHGIEAPEVRAAAGKPERGRISVALEREGSEVVLSISDDGAGINLMKVREKAIERGLMRPDAELSNNEILQFILQAGFSTADKVTQISGRGVGMDVVSAEIKQIGGTVHINSQAGQGTEFIVRLPFTVSVNRALMVKIGEDLFALPLNTIEGIVRLSPFELEHYYRTEGAHFEYAGEPYEVSYFGTLLKSGARPKLDGRDMQLPVLLVRSEGHAMALQVDAIMGSREIVVKSLGPQFAGVQGVSGATVTGDGTVVVILDPHALLRRQAAQLARPDVAKLESKPQVLPEPEERQLKVMVVDDSVTVRKVTSRFLEREGYLVTTAKDGQDAVIQLQDQIPDLILLDIEMPRMDGFEVARHIRGNQRLRDIPIVMITSRTGSKHRDYALSLGVNHYLGKPYQEEVLLETIREYTGEAAASG
ncbi:Hpt domain-containing protein [Microbulbifer thermotolerans]|uniref:hybrid sensor histidine kinase/response regulator n=1 Tax=Microbulbifer thermotolerans TaxID=252514 RepID=UPI0022494235|nr:Hpt domain-containing protein [Microbulbifer thermotolerans]MCX2795511.1 Hpt domain-containing protein [Microbulbifer thermotolerans]